MDPPVNTIPILEALGMDWEKDVLEDFNRPYGTNSMTYMGELSNMNIHQPDTFTQIEKIHNFVALLLRERDNAMRDSQLEKEKVFALKVENDDLKDKLATVSKELALLKVKNDLDSHNIRDQIRAQSLLRDENSRLKNEVADFIKTKEINASKMKNELIPYYENLRSKLIKYKSLYDDLKKECKCHTEGSNRDQKPNHQTNGFLPDERNFAFRKTGFPETEMPVHSTRTAVEPIPPLSTQNSDCVSSEIFGKSGETCESNCESCRRLNLERGYDWEADEVNDYT